MGLRSPMSSKARSLLLFGSVFVPVLALYSVTMAPEVTSEDSGELITAAFTLGVAHPPGYPLWCLLANAFCALPWGSVAWRVHLLSGICGAASAGLVAVIARDLAAGAPAARLSGWIFGSSRDLWSQAVVAEVYTLNVALILVVLLAVLRFERTGAAGWRDIAALAAGFGCAHHSTMGPLVILFAAWTVIRCPRIVAATPRGLVRPCALFALGSSVVLYIPIRSVADPYLDWGDPETLAGLWDHLTRQSYAKGEAATRTVLHQARLFGHLVATFLSQFTPIAGVLACAGVAVLWKRDRAATVLLVSLATMTSWGFVWLLDDPLDREHQHLIRVLFLPSWAISAIFLASALAVIASRVGRLPAGRVICVLVSCGIALAPFRAHFAVNDRSSDYVAYDWGHALLDSAPRDAILIPEADHATFPLLYLQAVEDLRPDVVIADKYGTIDDRTMRELCGDGAALAGADRAARVRALVEHSGRPVLLTSHARAPALPSWRWESRGLYFQAVHVRERAWTATEHDAHWRSCALRPRSLETPPGELGNDLILGDYHFARGRYLLATARRDESLSEFASAAARAAGIKEALNTLAAWLAESGEHAAAKPWLHEALEIDANYTPALVNLGRVYHDLGDYAEGFAWIRAASDRAPSDRSLRLARARAFAATGRLDMARTVYRQLLVTGPASEELQREAEPFTRAGDGDRQSASGWEGLSDG